MSRKVGSEKQQSEIIRSLYVRAVALNWTCLAQKAKTAQYEAWVDDPDIGGRLCQWMSRAEARVWIKDGPMHEYARALANVGRYACFLSEHPRSAQEVIAQCLGNDWSLVPNTIQTKPLRCVATRQRERVHVIWGCHSHWATLLWTGFRALEDLGLPVVIAPWDTVSKPATEHACGQRKRAAQKLNIEVQHIRLAG